ncbi:MAG: hypothetical protein DRJ62_06815 [Thermoprotei archaeon]|nr:MAG: hypothetical protein DRJ62_06815 [Thermoprotei archaeon]
MLLLPLKWSQEAASTANNLLLELRRASPLVAALDVDAEFEEIIAVKGCTSRFILEGCLNDTSV